MHPLRFKKMSNENPMLVRVYVPKKFLLGYRLIMLSVALVFVWDIYSLWDLGYYVSKGVKYYMGSGPFVFYIGRQLIFCLVFLWLATGGTSEKVDDQ